MTSMADVMLTSMTIRKEEFRTCMTATPVFLLRDDGLR